MHEKKKRAALVFFGLIVALLIVEGLLRFLGWTFLYMQERENRKPTLSTGVQLDQARVNQLNQEEGKEIVVLCIGESTTAYGEINSWPRQLQRILNNIQDQKSFRVINKGIPGAQTAEISTRLSGWLSQYRPDLVLAMVGINDRPQDFLPVESVPENTLPDQLLWTPLLNNLRTYGLIKWIAGGIKARVTEKTDDIATPNVVGAIDNERHLPYYYLRDPRFNVLHPQTIRNLNAMVNLTTDQGITFIFVQYALRKTDILRNAIEHEQNVVYVSNYEIFVDLLTQYNYEYLFWDNVFGDFGHATPFANRIIADNVARQLLKHMESQGQDN
jgi:hypothetical protein